MAEDMRVLEYERPLLKERLMPSRQVMVGMGATVAIQFMFQGMMNGGGRGWPYSAIFLGVYGWVMVLILARHLQWLTVYSDRLMWRTPMRRAVEIELCKVTRVDREEWKGFWSVGGMRQRGVRVSVEGAGGKLKTYRIPTLRGERVVALVQRHQQSGTEPMAPAQVLSVEPGGGREQVEFHEVVRAKRPWAGLVTNAVVAVGICYWLTHKKGAFHGMQAVVVSVLTACFLVGSGIIQMLTKVETRVTGGRVQVQMLWWGVEIDGEEIEHLEVVEVPRTGLFRLRRQVSMAEEWYRAKEPWSVRIVRRDGGAVRIDTRRPEELKRALEAARA